MLGRPQPVAVCKLNEGPVVVAFAYIHLCQAGLAEQHLHAMSCPATQREPSQCCQPILPVSGTTTQLCTDAVTGALSKLAPEQPMACWVLLLLLLPASQVNMGPADLLARLTAPQWGSSRPSASHIRLLAGPYLVSLYWEWKLEDCGLGLSYITELNHNIGERVTEVIRMRQVSAGTDKQRWAGSSRSSGEHGCTPPKRYPCNMLAYVGLMALLLGHAWYCACMHAGEGVYSIQPTKTHRTENQQFCRAAQGASPNGQHGTTWQMQAAITLSIMSHTSGGCSAHRARAKSPELLETGQAAPPLPCHMCCSRVPFTGPNRS